MSKEWHENIPENGVLCKEKSSGSIVRIMGKSNLLDSMVMDDCRSRNHFGTDEMTPLTAAEWWEFAPWNGMGKSVPANNNFLVMTRHREIATVYLSKHGTIRREHSGSEILIKDCLKWLPLPAGDL